MHRTVSLIVVSALTLGAAGCLARLEASLPDACFSEHGITVDGVAAGGGQINTSFTHDVSKDLRDVFDHGVQAEAHVLDATLTSEDAAVTSFSFVQSATVQVGPTDTGSSLPTLVLVHCEAGACGETGNQMSVNAISQVDIITYLRAGALKFDLVLDGEPPQQDWKLGIDVCLSAKASITE